MQENVILAYYGQIWKFSPRLPKMSPQPQPDIKFKSSYARKRDFSLLCPNMEIRPQAPKNGIFQKIFKKESLQPPADISLSQVMQENISSNKLSLGLNFSTRAGRNQSFT